ncbi:hypothetical protein LAZ40_11615 [Cereibacter sphaeroides]|uniref:hypothetical protein n=1 Tax=Cereibacter sphaeroides TaxID=1063 RepID=UPI001F489F68|nr:hypothetical protein [Cereibacter sphaeroides]MCE6959666.1 hypothetical protein [Cereibacter sphaeroides]MCE6974473.1 hypothetical protein [Cereibacter sphaeroides]
MSETPDHEDLLSLISQRPKSRFARLLAGAQGDDPGPDMAGFPDVPDQAVPAPAPEPEPEASPPVPPGAAPQPDITEAPSPEAPTLVAPPEPAAAPVEAAVEVPIETSVEAPVEVAVDEPARPAGRRIVDAGAGRERRSRPAAAPAPAVVPPAPLPVRPSQAGLDDDVDAVLEDPSVLQAPPADPFGGIPPADPTSGAGFSMPGAQPSAEIDLPKERKRAYLERLTDLRANIISSGDDPIEIPAHEKTLSEQLEELGIPPRPHRWPRFIAWPPRHQLERLQQPDIDKEKVKEWIEHMLQMEKRMQERSDEIHAWLEKFGPQGLQRNIFEKRRLKRMPTDPYHGIHWACLLDEKAANPAAMGRVRTWSHMRARTVDGGLVKAYHDCVNVAVPTPESVHLGMMEARARGWGTLRMSGSPEFAKLAIEAARRENIPAEITIRYGLWWRTIKVTPLPPGVVPELPKEDQEKSKDGQENSKGQTGGAALPRTSPTTPASALPSKRAAAAERVDEIDEILDEDEPDAPVPLAPSVLAAQKRSTGRKEAAPGPAFGLPGGAPPSTLDRTAASASSGREAASPAAIETGPNPAAAPETRPEDGETATPAA